MMKGLSLWEPWASFIARGLKRIETRGWRTPYRGDIAIHAAKTTQELYAYRLKLAEAGVIASLDEPDDFPKEDRDWPLGKIVAVATLTDCVPAHTVSAGLSRMERAFGNYEGKRFAWLLADVRPLREPLACVGHQWLFDLDAATEARVRAAA
jgi:activating signal cointegrator 1